MELLCLQGRAEGVAYLIGDLMCVGVEGSDSTCAYREHSLIPDKEC